MTAPPVQDQPRGGEPKPPSEDKLAAAVVLGIHRLTKGATLYDADNQAAIRQLEMTRRAVVNYGRVARVNPKLFFTEKSVFVGGRLLRAGRTVYAAALELGRILKRFEIDEVAIGFDVPAEDLRLFQDAMRNALRNQGPSPAQQRYQRIRLRRGRPPGRRNDTLTPQEALVRSYATATIVMRRFLGEIQKNDFKMPVGVIRVAQQLAELTCIDNPAILGTTAIYNSKHEHAGRAVNAALLALSMGRQLTSDRRTLARIAMAALLFDVGLPRIAGMGPLGEERVGVMLPRIIEQQFAELPACSAGTTWALGGFGNAAIQHTVLVYESLSVAYHNHTTPPYSGLRRPTLQSRIVAVARRFIDLLANMELELTPDQAISRLLRADADQANTTIIQLLLSSLGLFTSGSLVRLSSGQVAQVVKTSDNPMLFSFPTVRPVLDPNGVRIANGTAIDLATSIGDPNGVRVTALVEIADDSKVRAKEQRRQRGTQLGMMPSSQSPAPPAATPSPPAPPAATPSPPAPQAATPSPPAPPAATPSPPAPQAAVRPSVPPPIDDRFRTDVVAAFETQQDGAMEVDLGMAEPSLARFEVPLSSRPEEGNDVAIHTTLPAVTETPELTPAASTPQPPQPPQPQPQPQPAAAVAVPAQPVSSGAAAPHAPSAATDLSWDLGGEDIEADDEDDVPSMVLQAIIDGRRDDADEDDAATAVFNASSPSPLHPLFFQKSNEAAPAQPNEAAPAPSSAAAAETDNETTTPRPQTGRGMTQAAQSAAISQRKPAPAAPTGEPPAAAPQEQPASQRPPLAMPPQRAKERAQAAARAKPATAASHRHNTTEWLKQKLTGARPTSQGTLQNTPLVHLLVYMLERKLSGTTMLVAEGMKTHFIYFHQGVPSKTLTTAGVAGLDQVLLKMGTLDENALRGSLAAIRASGELHGRYLVKAGLLDVPSVRATLQLQLMYKLSFMLTLPPTTRFAYYDGTNMLEDYGGPELTPIDPLFVIMMGVRSLVRSPLVDATLSKLGTPPLRLRREANIVRLGLLDTERAIVDLLRSRPLTLRDILQRQVAHEATVKVLIYGLIITRCINLGKNNRPPVGHDSDVVPQLWNPNDQASPRRSSPGTAEPVASSNKPRMDRPQPRRSTSSTRGQPLPRQGTSSSRGEDLPRSSPDSSPASRPSQPRAPIAPPLQPKTRPAVARARRAPPPAAPQPTAASATPAPQAPRRQSSSNNITRRDVQTRAKVMGQQTLYEILGVAKTASADEIQTAYFAQARSWHPDRLPRDLGDMAAKIFTRINDAYQTLSHVDLRKEYDSVVARGGGTAKDREVLERAVDAGLLFQKGEVMFKKGDYSQAEELLNEAVASDPDQPEYMALLAWIQAHRIQPPTQESERRHHYDAYLQMLDTVISKDPQYSKAYYYRGALYKRAGQSERAMFDFRKVMELDPRNIDAAREVRVYDMRQNKKQNDGSGGLFGRFFKKK